MPLFRAYRIFEENGKSAGRFVELTLDDLDSGEVVIQVHYSSVNYKDALAATGAGRVVRRFPCIGGVDAAGVVVSSSDARFNAGDAVLVTGYGMGVDHDGGFAEYMRVPADWVVPLPQGLTLFDAMTIGTAGFAAALSIHRLEQNDLRPENGKVIVTGATGGGASLAIHMLAQLGDNVHAQTGKAAYHLPCAGRRERVLVIHTGVMRLDDHLTGIKIVQCQRDEMAGGLAAFLEDAVGRKFICRAGLVFEHQLQSLVCFLATHAVCSSTKSLLVIPAKFCGALCDFCPA